MRETWYVLDDGTYADPNEVAPDAAGRLRHKNGAAVAMRGQVPHTSGVDPVAERAKAKAKAEPSETASDAHTSKDQKPEGHKQGYKTRESKAD